MLDFQMKSAFFRMSKQSGAHALSLTAFSIKEQGRWAEAVSEKWLVPYSLRLQPGDPQSETRLGSDRNVMPLF